MSNKKIIPKKIPMRKQDPLKRAKNFFEVALGYTSEEAIKEAKRCLECKKPSCVKGCPVEIDIPGFIKKIKEGEFLEAATLIKENNPLPAVCGRVCPQEDQCEKVCVLARKGESVAIGRLERFAADYEAKEKDQTLFLSKSSSKRKGKKVAVVGLSLIHI